jgi:hypothetical protein
LRVDQYQQLEQFLNYLERNDILIKEQSGFRAVYSCETSLNLTLDYRRAVFLDFKRAFETYCYENWSSIVLKVQNLNGLEAI